MDKRTDEIKKVIEEYGTRLDPLSAKEIAKFLGLDEHTFGSSLIRLIRSEPHIHRRRPVSQFGKSLFMYWPDPDVINPEYKGTVKKLPRQVAVPKTPSQLPAVIELPATSDVAHIVIPISTGRLSLALHDARNAYHHLKEIFS